MGSPTETLDQWAARVGPTLTDRGWREAEHISTSDKSGLIEVDSGDERITPAWARALLCFRSGLVAELTDQERAVLLGFLRHGPTLRGLVDKGIMVASYDDGAYIMASALTPLGWEIVRVLEARDA